MAEEKKEEKLCLILNMVNWSDFEVTNLRLVEGTFEGTLINKKTGKEVSKVKFTVEFNNPQTAKTYIPADTILQLFLNSQRKQPPDQ